VLIELICAVGLGAEGPAVPFSASVSKDPETGWTMVKLAYRDPGRTDRSLEATIVPEAGSNLCSLKVGGVELLRQPPRLFRVKRLRYHSRLRVHHVHHLPLASPRQLHNLRPLHRCRIRGRRHRLHERR
jgi:hypothetical protein